MLNNVNNALFYSMTVGSILTMALKFVLTRDKELGIMSSSRMG